MRTSLNLVGLICTTALILSGCRDINPWGPNDPNDPGNQSVGVTIPELCGVEWKLQAFEEWSGGKISASTPVADFLVYTATFTEGGVSGGDACNFYKGAYALGKNNALSIFNIYEPEVACGPASPDGAFIAALPEAESYSATLTTLRIFYRGGTKALYFTRSLSSISLVQLELILFAPGDPFQLNDAGINGDVLTMDVTYSGGCGEHTFDLYGPKTIPGGDPTPITAYFIHHANGDMCEALITKRVDFDLTPLKNQWRQETGRTSGEIDLTIGSFGAGGAPRTILYRF